MRPSPKWLLAVLVLTAARAAAQLGPPPVPPENPLTEEKRVLGKVLFWDEQLSVDDTVACGTCHIPSAGGADPRLGPGAVHPGPDGVLGTNDDERNSPGVATFDAHGRFRPDALFGFGPQVTERRAPSTIGAAYFEELFWDGRAGGEFVDPESGQVRIASGGALETQSLAPILNSVEMSAPHRTWDDVRAKLARVRPLALAFDWTPDLAQALDGGRAYEDLFADAFGDPAITAERIAFALATYQRTLVPDQTPWDRFMAGDADALTSEQRQGWSIFQKGNSRCSICHAPPLFSDGTYRNLGLRPVAEDAGRQSVTGAFDDRGRFKVPSLRNAARRAAFFHTGTPALDTLAQIVRFYDAGGGPFDDNRDPLIAGIAIPKQAAAPLLAFLSGALVDPRVADELPPFDRPRLNSERPHPGPVSEGGAVPGSGGFLPRVIARSPVALGAAGFRLGVHGALGGAPALVVVELTRAGSGGPLSVPYTSIVLTSLAGAGPGGGYGTFQTALPSDPALLGAELAWQWFVRDPAAPGGVARSDRVRGTLF